MATSRKRNVEIDVVVDDKKARAALKGVADETGKTGKAFSKMAGFMAGALAVTKVVDFARDSIRAFSDLNESMNAVQVTFGDASDEVKQLGEEAAQSVGLSNAEFNSLAVQMSAFAQTIAGDSGDVAGTIDTLTTRIADFASVMNLDVAEAARLFQSGLAGETEPLRRYGLDLSAAAVTAHGLAMGLGDSSGKLSEQEKILARYDSLMEQTNKTAGDFANTSDDLANKTRIVAAETENAKAVIGEGFAPVMEAAVPIMGAATTNMGILATQFMETTGQIGEAESHIRQFETATGQTANTGAALLTLLKEFGGDMEELVGVVPLATDEIQKLRDADDDFLTSLGFTQDEIDELNQLLEDKLVSAARSARDQGIHPVRDASDDMTESVEDAADATGDLGEAAEDAKTALELFKEEVVSQTDPLFNLARQTKDVADAKQAVIDAEDEFGRNSPEYVAAVSSLAEEAFNLKEAQLAVADQSGLTEGEFRANLTAMGVLTQEQIDTIIEEFERVNAFQFSDKTIRVGTRFSGDTPGHDFGGNRARGGPVSSGETYVVGEEGPELLQMGSGSGHITPNDQITTGGGGGLTVVVQGFVGSEAQLAAELDRLLTNRKRRSGLSLL